MRLLICAAAVIGVVSASLCANAVELDPYMQTNSFSTYIEVYGNNTYPVTEKIDVSFLKERHGIYR